MRKTAEWIEMPLGSWHVLIQGTIHHMGTEIGWIHSQLEPFWHITLYLWTLV